nr:AP-4 complex subunit beta-1-like [Biomphalaria glabrata]
MYKMADITELNKLLHNLNDSDFLKDIRAVRISVYKILSLANDGCDVSAALPTVVKLLALGDSFVKRVAGEIITLFAEKNPEMVMLATNTLLQDSKDINPIIRSLGLRILSSLHSESSIEMLTNAVMQGLEDGSPHVRRQAALTSVFLYQMAPNVVMEGGIWDSLYGHLSDSDSPTVACCLCALEEIFASEKGIVVSNKLGHYLIGKMYSFSPCVQRYVLQFLLKYSPKSKVQVFEHLNDLDNSLTNGTCLPINLCTLELFCHFTSSLPKVKLKAYLSGWKTIKLHFTRERNEEMVTAIIDYLCQTNFPIDVITKDFNKFFCRDDDAQYLMEQKIRILCRLISAENSEHILEEFFIIAKRLEKEALKKMILRLTETVSLKPELERHYVLFLKRLMQLGTSGVIDCLVQVLVKVKFCSQENWLIVAPSLQDHYQEIHSTLGKIALLEVIRSQGEHLPDAPCILEQIMDELDLDTKDSHFSHSLDQDLVKQQHKQLIKVSLLGAMVKMCLHNASKIQPLLSRLMDICMCDKDRNVRDRALFLYGSLCSQVMTLTGTQIT